MIPARTTLLRHALRAAGPLAALTALTASGCYFSDEGLSPPTHGFYFPTGLAVSPGRNALYVANSDFDLQYNGGTVQVLDLRQTRGTLNDMLARLRCFQGAADACASLPAGEPPPTSVAEACARTHAGVLGAPLAKNDNQILTPSACTPMEPPFVSPGTTFSVIGAFASGAVVATNPDGVGARLFVPVRGDPSITWFDVTDDRDPSVTDVSLLDCGQCHIDDACQDGSRCCSGVCDQTTRHCQAPDASVVPRCNDDHRIGTRPYDNLRGATIPVEPVGIDASDDGTSIVSVHQIDGAPAIGLSLNTWPTAAHPRPQPTFEYSLTFNVPAGPTEVAHVPASAYVKRRLADAGAGKAPPFAYQPGFLVTYNAAAEIDLFRYNDDALSVPPKPFLTRAAATSVNANADGKDSRGAVIDPTKRNACEASCTAGGGPASGVCAGSPDEESCLRCCVDVPLDLYVANRAPASLLLGHVRTTIVDSDQGSGAAASSAFDVPEIYDVVSLTTGPSKVSLGEIIGADGKLHRRVFAVAFDSTFVFGYDPEARLVDTVIKTSRGPHAIAFDTQAPANDGTGGHSHLYVGHFTDSFLGVVDLDMRHPETYGIMFASIGTPIEPRESK